jgi:hypothetical protein
MVPRWSGGVTIAETVLAGVYIGKIFFKNLLLKSLCDKKA